ncbi:MAG: PAS domain S-box protein [Methanoregula sp.]
MKKETSQTPFDQRLFLIFIVTFASMIAFEFAAQFLFPYAPDWRSNLITSLFTSGLAVIIAYFPLNNYYSTATKLSSEVERRHVVENELREREEQLRRTFDQSPVGSGILSTDLRFTRVNDTLCAITGYTPEELLSQSVTSILLPEEIKQVITCTETLKRGDANGDESDLHLVRKNGDKIWVHQSIRLIREDDGTPLYFIPMYLDINDRKLTEDALQKTNKKLSILSAITRHDIRNQLTGLSVFLQLMKNEFQNDPVLQNYVVKLIACSEAIERQIEFTRNYEDLGSATASWFDVYRGIFEEAQHLPLEGITVDTGVKGYSIYADPLIGKVYYNLIENSLRHGDHVTKIAFTMNETENGLEILYTDNGVGIQPLEKEKIFLRGYGRNTGLGLFLIREILATTGINITEIGTHGAGAQFEIIVPRGAYRFSES